MSKCTSTTSKSMNVRAILCGVLALLLPLSALAQAPSLINYQGRLLNGTNLVNGTVGLSLRLYDAVTGGTVLYEDSNIVAVVDGLYSTFIGDNTTAGELDDALAATNAWLEVAVGNVALTPRERLASVPYAIYADTASSLSGFTASSFATGTPLYVESDPSWAAASNSVQGQLNANASLLATTTSQLAQVATESAVNAAEVDALQVQVVALSNQVAANERRIEAGRTNLVELGPTRFHVSFSQPFGTPPVVSLTPGLPSSDAHVVSVTTTGFLGVATATGFAVQVTTLSPVRDDGRAASLAIINGNPAISYADSTRKLLMYVRSTNAANSADVRAWAPPVEVLQTPVTAGIGFSALLEVNGRPAIAYEDTAFGTNNLGSIKYVRALNAEGTAWGAPVTVATSPNSLSLTDTTPFMSIVNGRPAMAFRGRTLTGVRLFYARAQDADGATWNAPVVVDDTGAGGRNSSLAVVNGNPAIAYIYDASNTLRYVRSSDADGTVWGAPLTLDATLSTSQGASLAVVNGHPAIAYHQAGSSNDLRYIRATNADGSSWAAPVAVDRPGNVGLLPTLQVVNGRPAIAYNQTNVPVSIKYVRASDVDGSAWEAPVTAYSFLSTVELLRAPMVVAGGNPSIAFYEAIEQSLRFTRAVDVDGLSWPETTVVNLELNGYARALNVNTQLVVVASGSGYLAWLAASNRAGTAWAPPAVITAIEPQAPALDFSVAMIGGHPAISYTDVFVDTNVITYIRALNPSGTLWGDPVVVETATRQIGRNLSLAEIGGRPAISYFDTNLSNASNDLRYVRALDATGGTWGASVLVTATNSFFSTGNVGRHSSLIEVEGRPVIHYQISSISGSSLGRHIGSDADGTTWSSVLTFGGNGFQNSSIYVMGQPASATASSSSNNAIAYHRSLGGATNWPANSIMIGESGTSTVSAISLAVIKEVPAVSYTRGTELRYVEARSGNTSGAALSANGDVLWDASVVLGTVSNRFSSMIDADGKALVCTLDTNGLVVLRVLPFGVDVNWLAIEP